MNRKARLIVFLPAHSVRHHRCRTDAEHPRQREHDERQIAGNAHRRDRIRPESPHPVEIDQEIQRLKRHRHEHEARRFQEMACDRSGGEILQ
ncbi:MAG: hypothetical protein WKF55_03200 [Gemmatimonadaceae bacterium]